MKIEFKPVPNLTVVRGDFVLVQLPSGNTYLVMALSAGSREMCGVVVSIHSSVGGCPLSLFDELHFTTDHVKEVYDATLTLSRRTR